MRLYADSLGIEGGDILNLFQSQMESSIIKKPTRPEKKAVLPPLEKIFLMWLTYRPVIIIIVVSAFVILSFAIIMKYKEQKSIEKFANTVKGSEIVEESIKEKMSLTIKAVELTWVSVSTDNRKPEEWLLRAGGTVTVTAWKKFVVKIGNAGGSRLIFNNRDIGELGPPGKVVDIVLP